MNFKEPKVSIILLNYNGFEDTIECFESLKNVNYNNFNIVIVDNASPDDSMDKIIYFMQENKFEYVYFSSPNEGTKHTIEKPKVSLIQSGFNGGYGHGNNIGIKYALKNNADYVLILNNDTIVDKNFLEPLVRVCEEDKNIGIASGKIYFHDRPDTIWFVGGKVNSYTSKVDHLYFNKIDSGQKIDDKISFISGCLWLIPKKVFNNTGFINEDYFMYVEDVEFCVRVLDKGYYLKVVDKSIIYHKVGNSSGGHESNFSTYWISKNTFKFISNKKNILKKFISYIYLLFYRSLRFLVKGQINSLKSHLRGIYDAI